MSEIIDRIVQAYGSSRIKARLDGWQQQRALEEEAEWLAQTHDLLIQLQEADASSYPMLPKALESEIIGQIWALDFLRGIDDVRWTYATPPKNLTNGERTGDYRVGGDAMLEDARGRSRVSRADFAVAIVDEAERAAHVNARFSIAY